MTTHKFLFTSSEWIGQGKLTFSHLAGHMRFYTKWIFEKKDQEIKAEQQIEQEGENDKLFNLYRITLNTPTTFSIELNNDLIGNVDGHGIIAAKTIAWEFRNKRGDNNNLFEGFEVYEFQENGDYMLHAEYCSGNYRTIIDGRIWQKK